MGGNGGGSSTTGCGAASAVPVAPGCPGGVDDRAVRVGEPPAARYARDITDCDLLPADIASCAAAGSGAVAKPACCAAALNGDGSAAPPAGALTVVVPRELACVAAVAAAGGDCPYLPPLTTELLSDQRVLMLFNLSRASSYTLESKSSAVTAPFSVERRRGFVSVLLRAVPEAPGMARGWLGAPGLWPGRPAALRAACADVPALSGVVLTAARPAWYVQGSVHLMQARGLARQA